MNSSREDVVLQMFPQSALHRKKIKNSLDSFSFGGLQVEAEGEAQSALLSKVPKHFNPDAGLHFESFNLDSVCLNTTIQVTNAAHSKIVSAHLLEEREFKFGNQNFGSDEEGSVSLALFQLAQHSLYSNFLSRKVYEDLHREWSFVSQEIVEQVRDANSTNVRLLAQVKNLIKGEGTNKERFNINLV